MAFFLGVDVGTSNVKALVVDGRGRAVARASEPLALATALPRPSMTSALTLPVPTSTPRKNAI